jgi:hypothetical protein
MTGMIPNIEWPPLQPLAWDEDSWCWSAEAASLPALWPTPFWLAVLPAESDDDATPEPSPGRRAAVDYLAASGEAVRAAAFEAIRSRGRRFGAASDAELAGRLRLSAVHVGGEERDGLALVGLDFHCDEYEHGVGVVLRRDRVVRLGVAEVAMDLEEAEADG